MVVESQKDKGIELSQKGRGIAYARGREEGLFSKFGSTCLTHSYAVVFIGDRGDTFHKCEAHVKEGVGVCGKMDLG